MNINIKYFGKLIDIAGKENVSINSKVESLGDLLNNLSRTIPKLKNEIYIIFVNNKKVDNLNLSLSENDEVCFMPPFSGG